MIPSFFFINNTRAPQGDTLDRMKPLSTRSYNCVFNSFNSVGAILYGGIKMGVDLGNRSIPNFNSQSGGNPSKSSINTFENSCTIGTLSKVTFRVEVSIRCAK